MSFTRPSNSKPAASCFHKIETLGYCEDVEAKRILLGVANSLQPIMKKRNWTVLLLSEFYPKNKNLFGLHVNHGEEIKVRLREPENVKVLLPFESVVGTVLHELAHFVHQKHDKPFYSLLDQLTVEYETCASGSGKGNFNSDTGHRLGGKIAKPPTKHEKRNLLAQAAERRLNRASLLCGTQKLGGSYLISNASPRQMAVLAAARRLNDQKWCITTSDYLQKEQLSNLYEDI